MIEQLLENYDKVVFFDTETTGFNPKDCDIIELGYLVYTKDDYIKKDMFIKLKEGETIPYKITEITGITDRKLLLSGRDRHDVTKEFLDDIKGNTILIAYNLPFDIAFLIEMCKKTGFSLEDYDTLDALTLYKLVAPYPHKLKDAILYFGLEEKVQNSHLAIDDALALKEVFLKISKLINVNKYINIYSYNPKYGVPNKAYKKARLISDREITKI